MKQKECSYCHRLNHTSLNCFRKKIDKAEEDRSKIKRPLKKESTKSMQKRQITKDTFFTLIKPDEEGMYDCYLQISPHCLKRMPKHYVSAEHCFSKQRFPELKYVPENILPSCQPCNALKLSNSPYQLAILFPNVKAMLETKWWLNFMDSLKKAIQDRNIQLYWDDEDRTFKRYPIEK
jgi:hypothetical protein